MPKSISPNELGKLLSENPDINIIDVRTPLEHREVHVAEADLHPLQELDPKRVSESVGANEPVYVLCRSGMRAGKAIEQLEAAGFSQAVLIEGGIQAWQAHDLPVVRGKKSVSIERQVSIAAGGLVLAFTVLGFLTGSLYWFGLSGLMGAGMMFSGITNSCAMGMCLAKMPWNKTEPATCPSMPGSDAKAEKPAAT